jgi:hypothetical protein
MMIADNDIRVDKVPFCDQPLNKEGVGYDRNDNPKEFCLDLLSCDIM